MNSPTTLQTDVSVERRRRRVSVLSVIGTRPEAIKMAPVIQALRRQADRFHSIVCVTGQHREMLDQMLYLFGIRPDHDLNIMRPGQTLVDVTTAVLQGVTQVIEFERPDWVVVQGDTTTTMAASMAAHYCRARIAHVEAGLRTGDLWAPHPEEFNRRVAGVVADLHFAPTEWAATNLRTEGTAAEKIIVTGNTVIDALLHVGQLPYAPADPDLMMIAHEDRRLVLVTTHRRENLGSPMDRICLGLRKVAQDHPEVRFVFPVHLNPNVRRPVFDSLGDIENVTLLGPLDYQPMIWLLKRCSFVITDSGGLQEEAVGLGKPVLVLRDATERPEGVSAGVAHLVGTDPVKLALWSSRLLHEEGSYYGEMARATDVYGDGEAATRIVQSLGASLRTGGWVPTFGQRTHRTADSSAAA
jgi:UDP-N-acetylglucosamine 2-epimerase (non-hydrolysing)